MSPSAGVLLENLPNPQFKLLVIALSKRENWKKIADFTEIFSKQEITALSNSPCPSEKLLSEFIDKLWTIEFLQIILKECRLHEALATISDPEQMRIISQPTKILKEGKEKLQVPLGGSFEIQFEVTGIPFPTFQWYRDEEALSGETEPTLSCDSFHPKLKGSFHCVATQETELKSESIEVDVLPIPCTLLESPDEIVYLCEGSFLCLRLKICAYPDPAYEWLFENNCLDEETHSFLLIKNVNQKNSGIYRCFIRNQISELVVKIKVIIYLENNFQIYNGPISKKVALLIGNETYDNLAQLQNPSNDIGSLGGILQNLGFRTFCLLNLNFKELKLAVELFSDVLDTEAVAFFYYAGHGFEMGDRFLLPVNVPKWDKVKKSDAVPESFILKQILNKNPLLLVLLLDMCLKMPHRGENAAIHSEVFTPQTFASNRNLIRGYSTTSHLSSYEVEENSNGIYVGILKKYLSADSCILTILSKVNSEISSTCPDQMPCISYITAQDFYLNAEAIGEDAGSLFNALTVKSEEMLINKAKILFHRFKGVFDNSFRIVIENAIQFQYELLTNFEICKSEDNGKTILHIENVQKMENDEFAILLKIDDVEVVIKKHFQIVNLLLDIM